MKRNFSHNSPLVTTKLSNEKFEKPCHIPNEGMEVISKQISADFQNLSKELRIYRWNQIRQLPIELLVLILQNKKMVATIESDKNFRSHIEQFLVTTTHRKSFYQPGLQYLTSQHVVSLVNTLATTSAVDFPSVIFYLLNNFNNDYEERSWILESLYNSGFFDFSHRYHNQHPELVSIFLNHITLSDLQKVAQLHHFQNNPAFKISTTFLNIWINKAKERIRYGYLWSFIHMHWPEHAQKILISELITTDKISIKNLPDLLFSPLSNQKALLSRIVNFAIALTTQNTYKDTIFDQLHSFKASLERRITIDYIKYLKHLFITLNVKNKSIPDLDKAILLLTMFDLFYKKSSVRKMNPHYFVQKTMRGYLKQSVSDLIHAELYEKFLQSHGERKDKLFNMLRESLELQIVQPTFNNYKLHIATKNFLKTLFDFTHLGPETFHNLCNFFYILTPYHDVSLPNSYLHDCNLICLPKNHHLLLTESLQLLGLTYNTGVNFYQSDFYPGLGKNLHVSLTFFQMSFKQFLCYQQSKYAPCHNFSIMPIILNPDINPTYFIGNSPAHFTVRIIKALEYQHFELDDQSFENILQAEQDERERRIFSIIQALSKHLIIQGTVTSKFHKQMASLLHCTYGDNLNYFMHSLTESFKMRYCNSIWPFARAQDTLNYISSNIWPLTLPATVRSVNLSPQFSQHNQLLFSHALGTDAPAMRKVMTQG